MKVIKERAAAFKPADISQAVRYGHLVLDSQPLRDQVTICLCTLQRVQFVRVFQWCFATSPISTSLRLRLSLSSEPSAFKQARACSSCTHT